MEEIRLILTYTNATPYKSKSGRYYCAYCAAEGPVFMEPDELRAHTRTKHAHERLRSVETFMKPYYANEILKLDIEKLQCNLCTERIDGWNDMFVHLQEQHNVELNEAYNRVIPYILKDDLACALCNAKFVHFHVLDAHMNAHYTNYICGECGDTFLAAVRLKKHEETHSTKQFPCKVCGKVFALEKYRMKHFKYVHARAQQFRCNYCPEKFLGEYARHLHMLEQHKEKVKTIRCDICFKTFTWRPYYLKHVRLQHATADRKKFKCKLCSKRFTQKHELKNHEDWHRGIGYTCNVCDKKFASKNYLQKHSMTHQDQNEGVVYILRTGVDSEEVVKSEKAVTVINEY